MGSVYRKRGGPGSPTRRVDARPAVRRIRRVPATLVSTTWPLLRRGRACYRTHHAVRASAAPERDLSAARAQVRVRRDVGLVARVRQPRRAGTRARANADRACATTVDRRPALSHRCDHQRATSRRPARGSFARRCGDKNRAPVCRESALLTFVIQVGGRELPWPPDRGARQARWTIRPCGSTRIKAVVTRHFAFSTFRRYWLPGGCFGACLADGELSGLIGRRCARRSRVSGCEGNAERAGGVEDACCGEPPDRESWCR